MTIHIGPMLRGEVQKIDIDYMLAIDPIPGLVFPNAAHVKGSLVDNAGYMRLSLSADLAYEAECARCLAPIAGTFSLDFERTVVTKGTLSEEQLEDNVDEYAVLDGPELCVDEEIRESLILEFPSKLLCSEDCAGLCPKCGKRLSEGDCGCPTKEIDPRLAVLKKLLDKE